MNTPSYTANELAERFSLQLHGNGDIRVSGVATLARAGRTQLAFLSNAHYRRQLADTHAGIVVLNAEDAEAVSGTALVAKNPYVAFAKIAALFETPAHHAAGIHPTAVIDPSAEISPTAHIGPLVSIAARARIEAGCMIGAGSVIGEDCIVGAGSELIARVTLVTRVRLGQRTRIHPGAVLGADGFGLAMDAGHWIKVPQLGGVSIGDDCEIGANTCIDRGALDDTVLDADVRLDNLIQVGHNVRIGAHTVIAGGTGIAGSTHIGRYCLIGGHVGIAGHLEIGDKVTVLGKSMVSHSIREPGQYSSSIPAVDSKAWRRTVARLRRLDRRTPRTSNHEQEPE
ncbi:MAG: UDP-3-O-(3-hydroxymyristoyl)glucosamine N-acyltransferase [Xanthomonadaceae bacterium]|jgi:UDP-3-O-[3-hydroxymyristoyl] glucosamine N-acyltransferase|nr:UDP-3-O-(3-hydroxymyristoyl)glucosamine N-acyltransferase [Xanthomonadaceae bacterium]